MSTKLFVGGLPWAMDNQRLKEVFAEFGDVEDARVVLDRQTGRSRGFGFVTFSTPEAAENALALNGQDVDGRPIRIDRAQEKQRPARGGGRSAGPDRPDRGGSDRGAPDRPGPGGPPGRSRGGPPSGDGGRREFGDDWGGGGGDRDRGRGGKGKGRGRRRGGRGGRGGGGDGGDGGSGGGGFNEWD